MPTPKTATAADDTTIVLWDDGGGIAATIRFPSKQHRDAAMKALKPMLDDALSVQCGKR
jgi:hypothetical protein